MEGALNMSIVKNDIPILEYDTDTRAVIMPDIDLLKEEGVF